MRLRGSSRDYEVWGANLLYLVHQVRLEGGMARSYRFLRYPTLLSHARQACAYVYMKIHFCTFEVLGVPTIQFIINSSHDSFATVTRKKSKKVFPTLCSYTGIAGPVPEECHFEYHQHEC